MTDICQNISSSSNSSYSYKSLKYWCSNCNRQFSQLSLEGSAPTSAQCPRCNLYADPTPQPANIQSSQSNPARANRPAHPQASRTSNPSSQPQGHPRNQRQPQQDQEYVYYTQPVMDPFGRVYTQTYRVPVNSQNQPRAARQQQPQQPRPQQQTNANNGNIFSQLFGNFFGFGGGNNYRYGAGVDESVIEEFLHNDPNNHGPAPAPQESINKLQQVKFDQHQHMDCEENKCCPVCQEDYEHGESLVRLPCGHDYHGECVKTWLTKHNSCPMCRKSI